MNTVTTRHARAGGVKHQIKPLWAAFNLSTQLLRIDDDFGDSVEESARMVAHLTVEQRQLALRLNGAGLVAAGDRA